MKKWNLLFLIILFVFGIPSPAANEKPDFTASFQVQPDQFIHLRLKNQSAAGYSILPEQKEKIFLTIYINNIKRADYKVKYIDAKLFKPNGNILFPTNFRAQKGIKILVEINPLKCIPESNYSNNKLVKQFN